MPHYSEFPNGRKTMFFVVRLNKTNNGLIITDRAHKKEQLLPLSEGSLIVEAFDEIGAFQNAGAMLAQLPNK